MNFLSIEATLPSKRLINEDILQMVIDENQQSLSSQELQSIIRLMKRFFSIAGTNTRYVREEGESAFSLIERAGASALKTANLCGKDIDLLIYVGIGRGFIEPATANIFQDRLNLTNATCFDLLDACASWVRALHVAKAFLVSGFYKRIMIISGEFLYNDNIDNHIKFKSIHDLQHMFAFFTMGEAATATILYESDEDDEYYASFKTYGNLRNLCMIPFPNVEEYNASKSDSTLKPFHFYSYSQELLAEGVEKSVTHCLEDDKINTYNPDIAFSHSASDFASDLVSSKLDGSGKLLFKTHGRFGNTVSSSIPLAMTTAVKENKLKHNDRVIIGMSSAGLSTGWTRFRFLNE